MTVHHHQQHDPLGFEPVSYSYRESSAGVWWNRISVTGGAFTIAMLTSWLLGRPRR